MGWKRKGDWRSHGYIEPTEYTREDKLWLLKWYGSCFLFVLMFLGLCLLATN